MVDLPALESLKIAPAGWTWRDQQKTLAEKIIASPKKIVIMQAEPGVGKSTIPLAAMAYSKSRGVVLVHTRQLEDQYLRDFPNLKKMEGRRHFTCELTDKPADQAPCTVGFSCHLRGKWNTATQFPLDTPSCAYFNAKAEARRAQVSVHNYSYFLAESKSVGSTFTKDIGWLVCDEAHGLDRALMDSEEIYISRNALKNFGLNTNFDLTKIDKWGEWINVVRFKVESKRASLMQELQRMGIKIPGTRSGPKDDFLDQYSDIQVEDEELVAEGWDTQTLANVGAISKRFAADRAIKDLRSINNLLDSFRSVHYYVVENKEEWIVEVEAASVKFRPLYGKYGFERIRPQVKDKIILMSAFLAPTLLMKNLGLDPNDVEVIEAEPAYDRTKSPINYCPVAKLSYKTTDSEWKMVIATIDKFIEQYAPSPGLIHVPSVAIRNRLLRQSRYAGSFITYEGTGALDSRQTPGLSKDRAISLFKSRSGFRVLLGQSISTGVDIPYIPTWQIIVKMTFPSLMDKVVKARSDKDPNFYPFITLCELIQATGRIKRAEDHDGTTIIIDAQFEWFFKQQRANFPKWFTNSLDLEGWKKYPEIQKALRTGK